MPNGVHCWSMSPSKYVQDAVWNTKQYLETTGGRKLPKQASSPWPTNFAAEMDATPELNLTCAQFYQSQIGVLHWMVEIGQVDIITEVSTLASYLALPQ